MQMHSSWPENLRTFFPFFRLKDYTAMPYNAVKNLPKSKVNLNTEVMQCRTALEELKHKAKDWLLYQKENKHIIQANQQWKSCKLMQGLHLLVENDD